MKPLGITVTLLLAMACALPAIAQSDETAKRFHVFPQLADGGGWQSFLLVTNVSQSSSFCTFALHGLSLDRFSEVSGITASGSTATFEIPGRGGYWVWPTKNESALASGYATLDCTASVVAQVLYASVGQSGGITGLATVFSSQAGRAFQFTVLTADASLGIAIANDTNTRTSCDVVLEDPDRMNLGDATISVLSKSNVARFLSQIIQIPPGFDGGSTTISCDQQVSVIGLQFAGAVFTTLPPAILPATATPTPPGPPTKPFNQQQTERLIGRWVFSYSIGSSGFTDTYTLRDVQESSINPGEWNIWGTDQYGGIVLAKYSPSLEEFSLFDEGTIIDQFFTFDFVGSSTVSVAGCYYLIDKDDDSLSRCYTMTGRRTSLSTSALSRGTSALSYATAAQAELGKIVEAENFWNDMQIEVNPMIIRALEDLRAYFAAHPEH